MFIVLAVGIWPQAHKFIVLVSNSGVHGFGIGHEHVNVELIQKVSDPLTLTMLSF